MISALALLVAVVLDRIYGEPPNAFHPVAWMGSAIARGRDWALRGSEGLGQCVRGGLVAVAIPLAAAVVALVLVLVTKPMPVLALLMTGILLKPLFAVRALRDAAFRIRDALVAGDLNEARSGLGSLCSRKADELEAPALIAATVESVAENASDSIIAPFFYYVLGGLPAVAFYRAVNTLDAMIGYHGRYEWVGKVAARLDDLLNLMPARLTAALFLVVAPFRQENFWRGATTLWRDGARTESPNAGRPMAVMAGLLGVRLEKHDHYVLGEATRPIESHDITRAWRVVAGATYVAVALSAGLALLAGWHG